MAARYPPAMHCFFRARCADDLFKNLIAIAWMHGGVPVAVKNNCRQGRLVGSDSAAGSATFPHGGKCGRHVSGGSAGKAGMDADRSIQIVIGYRHDSPSGRSSRKSTDIDAFWINRIIAHDLISDARDKRGLASAAMLVACAKP